MTLHLAQSIYSWRKRKWGDDVDLDGVDGRSDNEIPVNFKCCKRWTMNEHSHSRICGVTQRKEPELYEWMRVKNSRRYRMSISCFQLTLKNTEFIDFLIIKSINAVNQFSIFIVDCLTSLMVTVFDISISHIYVHVVAVWFPAMLDDDKIANTSWSDFWGFFWVFSLNL